MASPTRVVCVICMFGFDIGNDGVVVGHVISRVTMSGTVVVVVNYTTSVVYIVVICVVVCVRGY